MGVMDPFSLWSQHLENSVLIERAFTSVVQDGKKAIRTRNQDDRLSCTRLATLLLAALMESRLNEAIWYYSGLKEDDRPPLLKMSVENRWRQLVAISFANRPKFEIVRHT